VSVDQWLKSGEYLPPVLRDFHDQKDLFKAMHETITDHPVIAGNDCVTPVNWVSGQMYVIDVFLWFMARRGYTLQRSRKKQDYVSLEQTIQKCEERRDAAFMSMFSKEGKS
jgi:hypothetical protein